VAREYGREEESKGIRVHLGDACDANVLAAAGVQSADVVAAVTGDDEDNLVISLLAKQEFGAPRVIARVNNPKNYWMFNEMWGVDVAVSTPHLLTGLVQEAVSVGNFVKLLDLKTLAPGSPAVDRTIQQLRMPRSATVVAVVRGGTVLPPTPDTKLHVGDEVMVLTTQDAEAEVTKVLVG
jgi:trk system potassium uptake protein TrkA